MPVYVVKYYYKGHAKSEIFNNNEKFRNKLLKLYDNKHVDNVRVCSDFILDFKYLSI
jgi:spore coat polysaccharide biosynthesis protein SpsF (cytidylyltransferase family)